MALFAIEMHVPPSEYRQLTITERNAFIDVYKEAAKQRRG